MNPKHLKIVASFVIVGGGIAYLLYSSMAANLEYYKTPDEVLAEVDRWVGARVRVSGTVKEGSLFHRPGTHDYAFSLTGGGAELPVAFTGVVPDTFGANVEVVVAGTLGEDGVLVGDNVLAKCPSKYEGAGSIPDEISAPGHPRAVSGPRDALDPEAAPPERATRDSTRAPGR